MSDARTSESGATPDAVNSHRESPAQTAGTPRRFRWKIGLAIVVLGLIVEVSAWQWASPDRTLQVFWSMPILSATALLIVLWWLFVSGLSWSARLVGLLVAAGLVGVAAMAVRVEGFEGAMIPRLRWRWTQSPEERADAYWRQLESQQMQDVLPAEPLEVTSDDWPGFRGALRNGVVTNAILRRDWNERPPRLVWKHPVGLGWSSFAVVGGFAFTQEQRGLNECVVCYDVETGRQVWLHSDSTRFSETLGSDGPRATPAVHQSRVYALGATGILNCLDAGTGRIQWTRNILDDADGKCMTWGMAGSPLIYDEHVIVSPGGPEKHQVVAYDCQTGEIVWSGGSHRSGYAAPRIESARGVAELLIFGGDGLSGFEPVTGRELWFIEWPNEQQINVAQPIAFRDEAVWIGSGYGKGSGLFDIVFDAEKQSWSLNAEARWTTTQLKPKFNGAVLRDNFVYGLDEGILTCLDIETGQRQWKRGRYGYGQLLLADDMLLIQAEDGDVVLVEANPTEHVEVARIHALDGKTWNHPVVCAGRLLVRNAAEAACFDIQE